MELLKEEDDIPMQYADEYDAIEKNEHSVYNAEVNPYAVERVRVDEKRRQRSAYWHFLDNKFQKKNVATYQQHVYNNEQPMMQYNNRHSHKHKAKKFQKNNFKKPPPAPPNTGVGLPP